MTDAHVTAHPNPRQGRRVLLAMLLITVLPVLLATASFYWFPPSGGHSYGELLPTKPVPPFAMRTVEGQPASVADLRGKWLLVVIDDAACDGGCSAALHAMRQIRLAQNADMDRLQRLWLVRDGKVPTLAAQALAEGAEIRLANAPIPLPGAQTQGIYLIDPLGNQVMRYPRSADPHRVIGEIGRLLKNNDAIG